MSRRRMAPAAEPRRPLVLVFGEGDHDRRAIRDLVVGMRPDLAGAVEERRQPLVLIKGTLPATGRTNAEQISRLARVESKTREVLAVLAHQDCDAVEPAHEATALHVERTLHAAGCPTPIAVTPAWEIEAWWLLFPEAVGKVVQGWRDPDAWLGRNVGLIENVKEALAKAVQPQRMPGRGSPRQYRESDSMAIARNIVEDGLLPSFQGGRRCTRHPDGAKNRYTYSASLEQFCAKVRGIPEPTSPRRAGAARTPRRRQAP